MRAYTEIADLEHFVLEESWVLAIEASPGHLVLRVDLVLDKDHPDLEPAAAGETHYSRPGLMVFDDVADLSWTNQPSRPAVDANGEEDWGHIDSMLWDKNHYEFSGDFGRLSISAGEVRCRLETVAPV
jgi:hypothetical protein